MSPAKRFKWMQIRYYISPLPVVRTVVRPQEVETTSYLEIKNGVQFWWRWNIDCFSTPLHTLCYNSPPDTNRVKQSQRKVNVLWWRNLLARGRSKHLPCLFCLDEGRNIFEMYDMLTLLTGIFYNSESADLKNKWHEHRIITYTIITLLKLCVENSSVDFL